MPNLTQRQWQEISPYLDEVLSLSGDERPGWLASFHTQRPDLAPFLDELLQEHVALNNEAFLSGQPANPFETSFAGQTLGAYRLISPIGEGGMGTVWLAERSDGRFERKVAIKFLRFSLGSQSGTQRFKREGKILAQLSHPHIAELLDAGVSTTGQPYIVLEHIEGQPIDAWCDEHRIDVNRRIKLFLDVLSAVSHAHASLVVHRDIKPSNVLVRTDGCVKLLDFGIAKLLADDSDLGSATQLTLEDGSALTPQYAAPEQITGGAITTATDVYALGALLYLLLTGKHPTGSDARSPAELVRAIVETEPPRPSDACLGTKGYAVAERRATTLDKLHRETRGDLDTILSKALKKHASERYTSVSAFAEDLQRYLNNEPISARPDTLAYRTAKFIRRNRVAVALASLAVLAIVAGSAGTLLQARTARAQRDFALRQLARAEASNDLMSFVLSDAAPSGKPFRVNELLDRAERIVNQQPAGDELTRVELLIAVGEQYANQDQTSKARHVLEQAYLLSQGLSDASLRAEAACGFADALARSGETGQAETLFQEGIHKVPGGPEFAGIRSDCLRLGSEVARDSGDTKTAIARILDAQRVAQNSLFPNKALELNLAIDTATSYRLAGQNREAVAAFEKAAATMTALGRENTENAVELFNSWAYALGQLGRPLEAVKLYERAINISRDSDSYEAVSPMILGNYGKALHVLGRLGQAAFYSEQACAKAKASGLEIAVNQSLLERARIYRDQGEIVRSDAMLAEVEPRLRRSLPPGHFAFAALDVEKAQNESRRNNLRVAMHFADEAVAIDEASIKSGGEGFDVLPSVLYTRAAIEVKAGLIDQAVADDSRAIKLLQAAIEPGTFSTQLARSFLSLGSALQAQGKHDEARAAFRTASEHFEKTLGSDDPNTRDARKLAGLAS